MATGKRTRSRGNPAGRRRIWPGALLVVVLAALALGWIYREALTGYTSTAAAFGARTACACRHVAGRTLADCRKDFEPGMGLVFLTEDEEAKSVSAHVPLLASDTARYREGAGCILDPWDS